MQYVILFTMILGLGSLVFLMRAIVLKKRRGSTLIAAFLFLITAGVCVWYFVPFQYTLAQEEQAGVRIIYTARDVDWELDNEERQEFLRQLDRVVVQREFFNGGSTRYENKSYVYFIIQSNEGAKVILGHLSLDGSNCSVLEGEQGRLVLVNQQPIVDYLNELIRMPEE